LHSDRCGALTNRKCLTPPAKLFTTNPVICLLASRVNISSPIQSFLKASPETDSSWNQPRPGPESPGGRGSSDFFVRSQSLPPTPTVATVASASSLRNVPAYSAI